MNSPPLINPPGLGFGGISSCYVKRTMKTTDSRPGKADPLKLNVFGTRFNRKQALFKGGIFGVPDLGFSEQYIVLMCEVRSMKNVLFQYMNSGV